MAEDVLRQGQALINLHLSRDFTSKMGCNGAQVCRRVHGKHGARNTV